MPLPLRSKSSTTSSAPRANTIGSAPRAKGLQRSNPSSRIARCGSNGKPIPKRTVSEGSSPRPQSQYNPEEFANCELPLIYKPKKIQQMGNNTYVFHCTTKGNSGTRFNKNMIVLVHGNGESNSINNTSCNERSGSFFFQAEEQPDTIHTTTYLTVVNPLRLTEEGEAHLKNLGGEIRNLIRLGPSEHAAFEDEFYLSKYPQIQRWAPGKFSNCLHLPLHQRLYDTTRTKQLSVDDPIAPASPHPDVEVFLFEQTVQPEALLYCPKKKALLAGDCLQAQRDNPFVNELGMKHLQDNGLLGHDHAHNEEDVNAAAADTNGNSNNNNSNSIVIISPLWLKSQCVVSNHSRKMKNSFRSNQAQRNKAFFTSSGKFKLQNDFKRLLQLNIKRFVSSSGNHVQSDDNGGIKDSILAAAEQACQLV